MPSSLTKLPIVDILQVGLAGLCFLLSLLAFWLLHQEQKRDGTPRKGILDNVRFFIIVNFFSAVLVGVLSLLAKSPATQTDPAGLTSRDYLVDYTFYVVDLSSWKPPAQGDNSPVYVTR